ncbi:MAG: extracellular solute-binding protein [Candidatus Omnitrophota bacterium]|jgi:ABC-type glycerol-3-phosphate transport system substrate-binding protein
MRELFCCLIIVLVGCVIIGLSGCATEEETAKPIITVWHWMTDRQSAFEELAKQYEQENGIRINFELYAPSDSYSQKVRAAAQCNTLPDIFGILGEKRLFASFVKAGYVLDLYPYMQADGGSWQDSFFAKALAVNEFIPGNSYGVEPGIYGVPLDITTIQMLYNKDLFNKMGLNPNEPPQSFEEFLAVGRQIKQAGLQGMVAGLAETWMIDCLANNFAFNLMGEDKFLATIRGEVPYTDPDWIKVLSLFKQMQEEGLLADGVVTMVNKVAEQLFANGKAVFAFNGSWCVNVYRSMNPDLNYGVMLPPKINSEYPVSIWGGAGSSFMVNARSKNREEVVGFLRWLTAEEQQIYLAQATNNLPANKKCLDDISPVLAQFADDMVLSTHPNTWGISELSLVTEFWSKGIQSILIGEKTPQEVAVLVETVKQRELAKKMR